MNNFFDEIRPLFGNKLIQSQVDGINTILDATEKHQIAFRAYLLATAFHETAFTMQPVRETRARSDEVAVRILDSAFENGRLQWVSKPYWWFDSEHKSWLGRGYVQLTHKANYEKAGREIGLDLVTSPSLAMRPSIAADILVRGCVEGWFTGKKLGDYLPGDYFNARRVVNGLDKAENISQYAKIFEKALSLDSEISRIENSPIFKVI